MRSIPIRLVSLSCLTLVLASCGAGAEGPAVPATTAVPPAAPQPASPPPAPAPLLSASHVLVQYAGAEHAGEKITRTKEQAHERARQVLAQARSGGDFANLAREYSDDAETASNGGFLGVFPSDRVMPQFARACAALAAGEISEVTESPFGFHVIRREEVDEVSARHVLIMYRGSERAPSNITRSKEQALARAQEVLAKARAGTDLAQLAKEYSDDLPSKTIGGDLGSFPHGHVVAEVDRAVFALEVGGISDVVESPFGYHVIQRYK